MCNADDKTDHHLRLQCSSNSTACAPVVSLCAERPPLLEETGVALTFGAFRMGYFYGGDGKSVMKVDLRNAAGFMRDAAAVMTNFLLPMKVWEV